MKNLNKTFIAALCGLLMSSFVSAGPAQDASTEKETESFRVGMYRIKNSLVMNLMLEKEKGVAVNVKLMDARGKVLHREYIGKGLRKVGQKFDFSAIDDGQYRIEITNGNERVTKNISLSTTEIAEVSGRKLIALN